MVDDNAPAAPEDAPKDEEQSRDAKPWCDMIEGAEKVFDEWHKTCDNIGKDYASSARLKSGGDREFQMLYANLEVLKPSIYARAPQPVVVQRFKDSNRAVARKTGEMLERALIASFDGEKVHDTLKRVRDDLALTGRGQMWLRYETYEKGDGIKESVRYEWVHRRDFLHEPSRIWAENGWVARGTWLTKEAGEKRFKDAWQNIAYVDAEDTADEYKIDKKARVWELWHRAKNLVVWVHPHAPEVLDIAPPHLNIEGFWPCPRPCFGTIEPDSLVPVPDASFYRDQLEEINELTARISALSESLKLVGFYASGSEDIGAAVELAMRQMNSGENRRVMVPLPGMSQMGGPAALRDAIVWLPVQEVAQTVKELVGLRRQLIDDVYQISGISDIMRGQTEASETLGAQQLKSQYGSIRIRDRQGEMVRIADGALNIAGEIMAENFSPQTLIEMSQIEDLPKQADVLAKHQQEAMQKIAQLAQQMQAPPQPGPDGQPPPPPDPAQFEQAKQGIIATHQKEAADIVTIEKVVSLLRNQKIRPFTLMIATDSTIQPDENAEKAARNEFSTAFAQTTNALAPLLAQAPEAADFAGEMLKFMLAPFRAGRQMEQAIDDFVEMMAKKAKEPRPPGPEVAKAEMEAKALEQDMQAKALELQDRQAERAAKAQQSQMDGAVKAQEAQAKQQNAAAEAMIRDAEMKAKLQEIGLKAQSDARAQAHAERIQQGEMQLQQMQIQLAAMKLQVEREKLMMQASGEQEETGEPYNEAFV